MLWLLAAIGVVMAFVTPPRDQLRAADWQLDGGAANGFEAGQPRMIQSGPEPVWIVRLNDNTFTAFAAVCRQQHCVFRWNPMLRVFSCPCHHGTYDLEGRPLPGSPGEALRSFFVNIKAGRVRVHLRRVIGDEV
jgi:Rieske Fe-S protein